MTLPVVLIIEDNEGHFRIMEKSFERFGVLNPIHQAVDGQQALDYLLRKGDFAGTALPDLLLLIIDLNLPKVTGIDVLRELVRHEHLNRIPRIILSTSDEPEDVASCKEYGYAAYYVKPPDYIKLTNYIKELNAGAGSRTSSLPGTGPLAPPVTPSEGGTKPLKPRR
ncbi:MAG TPA: response regulator [Aggregatilineales bacterium]|nr:response regulator [Aggregatilineales bacterium]